MMEPCVRKWKKSFLCFFIAVCMLVPFGFATRAFADDIEQKSDSLESSEQEGDTVLQEEQNDVKNDDSSEKETPKEDDDPSEKETPKKDDDPSKKGTPKKDGDPSKKGIPKKDDDPSESEKGIKIGAGFSEFDPEEVEEPEEPEDSGDPENLDAPPELLPSEIEEDEKKPFSFMDKRGWLFICLMGAGALLAVAVSAFFVFRAHRKRKKRLPEEGIDFNKIVPLGPSEPPIGSLSVTCSSIIGTREYQQDCIKTPRLCGISDSVVEEKGCFCVLCDGMGGLEGGERASNTCAQVMMDMVYSSRRGDILQQIKCSTDFADQTIHSFKNANGEDVKCGTTMVCAYIKDGYLFHANVGDSRLYLYRDGMLSLLSKDHNYFEELVDGEPIGSEKWKRANQNPQKEALTSYVGMGGLRHYDCSESPVKLKEGDILFLCSDGLYRVLSEAELRALLSQYGEYPDFLPHVMTAAAMDKNRVHQDNTSIISIKYLG